MGCPADETLIELVERSLAPEAMAQLAEHVDGCERCRATVGHLAAVEGGRAAHAVGRYQLEDRLGSGGMGVVWKAWDPMLERRVAIKLLRPDVGEHGTARLLREARALAQLQHPNVVAVHDVGEVDGEVFIATELVDGQPLDRWQRGRAPDELVGAYVQAARGLAAAHHMGLVHRDVKPSNLLVAHDGRVRVGDFGLVSRGDAAPARGTADRDGQLTLDGDVVGTPAYMAPEQRAGAAVDARVDQFALCVALAEALTGERPVANTTAAELRALRPVDAPWAVLARGLARDPAARFATMTALGHALAAHGAPARPRLRLLPWLVAGAGVVVAAGAIVVAGREAPAPAIAAIAIDATPAPAPALAIDRSPPDAAAIVVNDAAPVDAAPPDAAPPRARPRPKRVFPPLEVVPSGIPECDDHQRAIAKLAACDHLPDVTHETLRDAMRQLHDQNAALPPRVLADPTARKTIGHGCELMRENVEKLSHGLGCS